MTKPYRDLCILTWARLVEYDENDGPIEYDSFRCVTLSNAGWWKGFECDDSPLSDMIGELGEENVFSSSDLGKLYIPFREYEGRYRVIPAIVVYTYSAGTHPSVSVKKVIPLEKAEIQDAIDFLLEGREETR